MRRSFYGDAGTREAMAHVGCGSPCKRLNCDLDAQHARRAPGPSHRGTRAFVTALSVLAIGVVVPGAEALDCLTFNASSIRLITFDVFAALMDSGDSMLANVHELLPSLNATELDSFVSDWFGVYGDNFGKTFNPSTQTPEPFTWVIRTGLESILQARGLAAKYPPGSAMFEALCASWGNLTPWPNTLQTLQKLSTRFHVAALSNGDAHTLRRATSVFLPNVTMYTVYSSDYPIGAFKPLAPIYMQATVPFGIEGVLHVAGSAIDGFGARSAGLYNALLHEQPQSGPQPCFVLNDITDLLPIMNL